MKIVEILSFFKRKMIYFLHKNVIILVISLDVELLSRRQ